MFADTIEQELIRRDKRIEESFRKLEEHEIANGGAQISTYPEDLAMHNPSAVAYGGMADNYVGPDQIMVRNPVAGLADDSAELPNLTEHVPVDELRNSAHDFEESQQQIQPNSCQIYLPSNRTTKSKSHKKANKNQLESQEFFSQNVSQDEVTNQLQHCTLRICKRR